MPNGYDFSEDDSVLEEQREDAKNTAEWANLNEKAIVAELDGLAARARECAQAVSRVLNENDCIHTRDLLRAFATNDLGAGGWLAAFYTANKDVFTKAAGPARAEDKKKYEEVLRYFRDVSQLIRVRTSMFSMFGNLKLVEGFRVDQVAYNLDKAGYNVDFYRKLNRDVENILLLSRDWLQLEEGAYRSKRYIESNLNKLPIDELDRGYREQRLADFREIVKSCGIAYFLTERSGGLAYSVDPRRRAALRVIDEYTAEIAELPDLTESMKRVVETSKKILPRTGRGPPPGGGGGPLYSNTAKSRDVSRRNRARPPTHNTRCYTSSVVSMRP